MAFFILCLDCCAKITFFAVCSKCKLQKIKIIAKKIDKEKSNELRKWMSDNNITKGINIDEDTKRFYPYSSLASNIIGFCGTDNQGLEGLEKTYDDVLTGTSGKIVTSKDASRSRNSINI